MFDFELDGLDLSWRVCRIPKPKKPGEFRKITIPNDSLKGVQRDILKFLYSVKELRPSCFAHGFVPFRNTSTGVKMHDRIADVILCMDVKDFFDTFPLQPIRDRLTGAGISDHLADRILKACSFNNTIPQGGPCSPYLTNIGMFETDLKLSSFAARNGFSYSRYADDLTFSKRLGPANDREVAGGFKYFFKGVDTLLKNSLGIELKWRKNHVIMLNSPVKRRVLGIVIRKDGLGYNAPKEMRRKARAMLCSLAHKIQGQGGVPSPEDAHSWAVVRGYVRYMDNIRSYSQEEAASADPVVQERYWNYLKGIFENGTRDRQHGPDGGGRTG